jgi:CheY-like chemotaxis protein
MRQDNLAFRPSPPREFAVSRPQITDPLEWAGGPAHDLQNLLAVILGVCESLAEDFDKGSEQAELARVALLAAERAGGLVGKLRLDPRQPRAIAGPPQAWPATAAAQPDGAGASVLIVEDDPDLLQLMTQAFLRAGFDTHAASNGRLGVRMLGDLQPDLMITDIVMPEMEGIATIIEAKRCSPDTRVIAISGGGKFGRSDNFLQWAEELGADEVLAKPFAMSSLIVAARVVIDRAAAAAPLELRERFAAR